MILLLVLVLVAVTGLLLSILAGSQRIADAIDRNTEQRRKESLRTSSR